MASGLLQKEKGYLYGKDALMQPLLDAYARTGKTPSPSDAARLGLLGYIAPVRSPYLDVDETSDDIRLEGAADRCLGSAWSALGREPPTRRRIGRILAGLVTSSDVLLDDENQRRLKLCASAVRNCNAFVCP